MTMPTTHPVGSRSERDWLVARVAELEQAFRRYAIHDEECPAYSYLEMPCGCGYREVLKSLSPE